LSDYVFLRFGYLVGGRTDFLPYCKLLSSHNGLAVPHVIITDGDPSDTGVLDGVTRARKLVSATTSTAMTLARADGDEELARTTARKGCVFIGPTTLELDMLPDARDAMVKTWNELNEGSKSQKNFAEAVDGYVGGDASQDKAILNRITRIEKGRYAQRLAAHLDAVDTPEHVAAALNVVCGW
jgi:putative ATP-dependent endonuclease of OLD family